MSTKLISQLNVKLILYILPLTTFHRQDDRSKLSVWLTQLACGTWHHPISKILTRLQFRSQHQHQHSPLSLPVDIDIDNEKTTKKRRIANPPDTTWSSVSISHPNPRILIFQHPCYSFFPTLLYSSKPRHIYQQPLSSPSERHPNLSKPLFTIRRVYSGVST
jgi:hypothetical protein